LSIISNACLNVVFLSEILKILSLGITINVSTFSFILANQSVAFSSLFFHSKLKGLVTIQIVRIHILFAIHAITGAAHVPVPHHIQAVTNTISASHKACFISFSDSSADFLQISGFAHAQSHLVIFIQILTFDDDKFAAKS
jgi:hypothetical protein